MDVIPSSSYGIVGERRVQLVAREEERYSGASPCMHQCISCSRNIDLRLTS